MATKLLTKRSCKRGRLVKKKSLMFSFTSHLSVIAISPLPPCVAIVPFLSLNHVVSEHTHGKGKVRSRIHSKNKNTLLESLQKSNFDLADDLSGSFLYTDEPERTSAKIKLGLLQLYGVCSVS
jgi:hypothetical protein